MGFTFNVGGIFTITEKLRDVSAEVKEEALQSGLEAAADLIVNDASDWAPYRSGLLRSGIRATAVAAEGETFEITVETLGPEHFGQHPTDYHYPAAIEFGRRALDGTMVPPTYFLRRALYENVPAVLRAVEGAIAGVVNSKGGG